MTVLQANANIAHSLYALYETLPDAVQREFLNELWQKQHQQLEEFAFYLACKQAKDENEFLSEKETQAFIQSLAQ